MLAVLMVVSLTACGRESVGTPGSELENGVAAIEDAMTAKPNKSSSASTAPMDDLRDGSSTDTVATPGDFLMHTTSAAARFPIIPAQHAAKDAGTGR